MKTEVFLDASYAIALSVPRDFYHSRAILLADEMGRKHTRLVTTRAVMLEIGNALSRRRHRSAVVKLLESLEADSSVAVVPLSEDVYLEAARLFAGRPDKE